MTGELNVEEGGYGLASLVPPPPVITSDIPPAAATWIEMATAALFGAANMGDPEDNAKAQKGHAEREALTSEAATRFPEGDQTQAAGMDQLAQQIPQMASGVAGAIGGAMGGMFQPLMQMPQQLAQTGQQLLQSGMGAFQQGAGTAGIGTAADWTADGLGGGFGADIGDGGSGGGGAGAGGGGVGGIGTAPMAMLGPPATPAATTTPTAGRVMAAPPAAAAMAAHPPTPMGGMGGVPMMPPGMHGAGAGGKEDKAATKRISVPTVRNGAPVQGRITAPPPALVTKNIEPKKIATRRVFVPGDSATQPADDKADRNV
jgi:hypothetical protein